MQQKVARAFRKKGSLAWGLVWLLALCVRGTAAPQSGGTKPAEPEMRSTLTGVYTAAQATAGETLYGDLCTGCHNLSVHTGQPFKLHWEGQPLADLYHIVADTMPDDDPGSLKPNQAAQLVAFLLKANGIPAGKDELPADADALKKIKIELPPKK
jgi:cbb3-type cytochrome c oxidase subunit III